MNFNVAFKSLQFEVYCNSVSVGGNIGIKEQFNHWWTNFKVPLTPKFFISRQKSPFCSDHIGEKIMISVALVKLHRI